MASQIFKGAVSYLIAITRRLIPIRGVPGMRAPGGIAFKCPVGTFLSEGRNYVLVDADGSRREVAVQKLSFDDSGGHGLAYYLETAGT